MKRFGSAAWLVISGMEKQFAHSADVTVSRIGPRAFWAPPSHGPLRRAAPQRISAIGTS
jgi:hypothetical protein